MNTHTDESAKGPAFMRLVTAVNTSDLSQQLDRFSGFLHRNRYDGLTQDQRECVMDVERAYEAIDMIEMIALRCLPGAFEDAWEESEEGQCVAKIEDLIATRAQVRL